MTAKEASEKWSITQRRVRVLYAQGKIPGADLLRNAWAIPIKPKDGRYKKDADLKGH
ncbi:hypothetical protein SDC9_211251 [bioreactor metagenome]|uniref:Helix-turn-helix domain-containing protein n=1 Tax=bioreactor metagenome TaxID=1076179 RepID=A0A645JJS2_9ZZZZ